VNEASATVAFTINPSGGGSGPLTISSFTSNLPSPRVAGTPITFTTTATGGAAPYEYKFWVFNGSSWSIGRDWNGSNTFTWTPLTPSPSASVTVWVRNATTMTDTADAQMTMPYPITAPASSGVLTIDAFTSNVPSPQASGTPITFTATVSGGTAPHQYKWWLFDGTSWIVLRDWNGGNTFTWTPAQANANYRIGVWVRNSTTTADVNEASVWLNYVIQ
jgi:hypothetical protein